MRLIKTATLLMATLLISVTATAGHHEKGDHMMLAAQPGQVMIVYHWPCADANAGLSLLKALIAYERDASPYPYSAAPALHEDGAVVSVDVHGSVASMNNATAWQAADEEWQAQFAVMAAACGSAEDLTAHVLTMQ
ncbi:hypothetical protein N9C62_00200 [Luminiphilus sp.]|nr:hypothetical protein [Luminiphilus sp.]